jgi:hypothetical protein
MLADDRGHRNMSIAKRALHDADQAFLSNQ